MTLEVCDYMGEPMDNGRDTLYIKVGKNAGNLHLIH